MIGLMIFEYKDLKNLTDNFCEKNFIHHAQYCKLYRGTIPHGWKGMEGREITVKIWDYEALVTNNQYSLHSWDQNLANFGDEMMLLRNLSTMPTRNMPNLIGYCREDDTQRLGVVYDVVSKDVLENLLDKERFKWHQRVKVALGLAKILEILHGNDYLIRDFSTAHIMLDQEWNPILFNFFGTTGGVVGDKIKDPDTFGPKELGSCRYIDNSIYHAGSWTENNDVHALGVMLLELIRKRMVSTNGEPGKVSFDYVDQLERVYIRRRSKFFGALNGCSLADPIFEIASGFHMRDACTITKLAMDCTTVFRPTRPSAKDIVYKLKNLIIVKERRHFMGVK